MERSQTNTIQLKNVKYVSLQNCCSGYEDLQNAKRYSSYAHKMFEWKAFAVGSIIAKTSNVSPPQKFYMVLRNFPRHQITFPWHQKIYWYGSHANTLFQFVNYDQILFTRAALTLANACSEFFYG